MQLKCEWTRNLAPLFLDQLSSLSLAEAAGERAFVTKEAAVSIKEEARLFSNPITIAYAVEQTKDGVVFAVFIIGRRR